MLFTVAIHENAKQEIWEQESRKILWTCYKTVRDNFLNPYPNKDGTTYELFDIYVGF